MKVPAAVVCLAFALSTAQAASFTFTGTLNSASEQNPLDTSPATGFTTVTYDNVSHILGVNFTYSGLVAPSTAAHIHCCTAAPLTGSAGVATPTPFFPGFITGVTSGTYSNTFDLTLASSWNPAFVTATGSVANAEATLFAGLQAGEAYLNVHSTAFPGGEIRAFLTPEPVSLSLMGSGLLALAVLRRRRKSA